MAGPANPALLARLGEHHRRLERLRTEGSFRFTTLTEELNSKGEVTQKTETLVEMRRGVATVRRSTCDGRDVTQKAQRKFDRPAPNQPSPFDPAQQANYNFRHLDEARLVFEPRGEASQQLLIGEAQVDFERGEVMHAAMRPSKNPPFVDSLVVEVVLGAVTPVGRALSELSIRGEVGALFVKRRFRSITRFEGYASGDRAP